MIIRNFISGHIDLTENEFEKHYKDKIDNAIKNNEHFIIGDANGADTMAQKYLKKQLTEESRVIVCHMFDNPRNNEGFKTVGGFLTDNERDAYMTSNSDKDILWIREGREKSGTAKNMKRRLSKNAS